MKSSYSTEILIGLLPAIIALLAVTAVTVHGVVRHARSHVVDRWLAVVGSGGAIVAIVAEAYRTRFTGTGVFVTTPGASHLAQGSLVIDRLSLLAGVVTFGVVLVGALLSGAFVARYPMRSSIYHATLLVAGSAAYLLESQHAMAMLIASLATLVLCVALLPALAKTDRISVGASLHTLVILGVALATVAYGAALLYGVTGVGDLYVAGEAFARHPIIVSIGTSLVVLGLLSCAGCLPLSRWWIDLVEGAPAVAGIGFALVIPAVLVCLMRIVGEGWGTDVWWLRSVIGADLALTVLYAAVMARRQPSVARLIGYTASGQVAVGAMGLVALGPGVTGHGAGGPAAILFEVIALVPVVIGLCAVLTVEELGDSPAQWRGLHRRNGALGAVTMLGIIGLGALPPSAVFLAHLLTGVSVMNSGMGWLVGLAAVGAALLLWAPLRLMAVVVGAPPRDTEAVVWDRPVYARIVIGICLSFPIIAAAFLGPLMGLATSASAVVGVH